MLADFFIWKGKLDRTGEEFSGSDWIGSDVGGGIELFLEILGSKIVLDVAEVEVEDFVLDLAAERSM